jgi:hypothetical protein
MRYLPQEEVKRKGEAFQRSVQKLVADKVVRHVAGVYWLGRAVARGSRATNATQPNAVQAEVARSHNPIGVRPRDPATAGLPLGKWEENPPAAPASVARLNATYATARATSGGDKEGCPQQDEFLNLVDEPL